MQTADRVQKHGVTRTCLHLENEAGQTQGRVMAPAFSPGTSRGAPLRAASLIVRFLTQGSGPLTRACLQVGPESFMGGISRLQTLEEPSHHRRQRKSPRPHHFISIAFY